MSELPIWTEDFGRLLLDANPWAAAVAQECDGNVLLWGGVPEVNDLGIYQCDGASRVAVGHFAIPIGKPWRDGIFVREPEKPAKPEPELPEWAARLLSEVSAVATPSKYGMVLKDEFALADFAGLLIEECERLRAQLAIVADTCETCPRKQLVKIADEALAEAAHLRAQLADLPRNADGDVVLPPCSGWAVRKSVIDSRPWVSSFRVTSIRRCVSGASWVANDGDFDVRLSDLYSTEASAKRAAEEVKK